MLWQYAGSAIVLGLAVHLLWTGLYHGLAQKKLELSYPDGSELILVDNEALWVGVVHVCLGLGAGAVGAVGLVSGLVGATEFSWRSGAGWLMAIPGFGMIALAGAILSIYGLRYGRFGSLWLGLPLLVMFGGATIGVMLS